MDRLVFSGHQKILMLCFLIKGIFLWIHNSLPTFTDKIHSCDMPLTSTNRMEINNKIINKSRQDYYLIQPCYAQTHIPLLSNSYLVDNPKIKYHVDNLKTKKIT